MDFVYVAAVLTLEDRSKLAMIACEPPGTTLDANELAVSRWALEQARMAGSGTDTRPGARSLAIPIGPAREPIAVLALLRADPTPLSADQRGFLQAFCRQASIALERTVLAERAGAALVRAQTEEMRSSLLAAVSHDLRTPLAAITGAASSLQSIGGLGGDVQLELVETIGESAERLERLVTNLLSMTRLESGAVTLRREWVPLEEIIGTVRTALEKLLAGREVRTAIDPDLPLVEVDPVLIDQLLVNLLENALRHAVDPPGAPKAPIELAARRDGDSVEITVADRGPGLPEEVRTRPFEKFVRGTGARGAGVGLGLAICHGIAAAHGGSITAESRPGGGTVFRVRLPIGVAPALLPAADGGAT